MKIVGRTGNKDIAVVYIAEMDNGKLVEFVESVQPPIPREKKWVLTISTLYGCPVGCRFCDAGGYYEGKISTEEILCQIDYLVNKRFPDKKIPVKKFKIQFARMGEPSFNPEVIDVLDRLPDLYNVPGLLISFSTIAPQGRDKFFERLLRIKKRRFTGRFQFQFSIHTTDEKLRNWLIPMKTWSFHNMSEYGKTFYENGDRKITLNFALGRGMPVNPDVLLRFFPPKLFLIKITPVNPTHRAAKHKIFSAIDLRQENRTVNVLQDAGYEVILSIGDLEENYIGSNCGQYITNFKIKNQHIDNGYTYKIQRF